MGALLLKKKYLDNKENLHKISRDKLEMIVTSVTACMTATRQVMFLKRCCEILVKIYAYAVHFPWLRISAANSFIWFNLFPTLTPTAWRWLCCTLLRLSVSLLLMITSSCNTHQDWKLSFSVECRTQTMKSKSLLLKL